MTADADEARFHVVGVGPGDPELMTLKAARIIGQADVVAYPTTSNGQSRAKRIAAAHIAPQQRNLAFHLPMQVDPAPAQAVYDRVAEQISGHLDAGQSVVLLCEGDPFLYGSALHLFVRLAGRYATHVVPGVSSMTAGAAMAGLPLAARSETLKVLPATMDEARLVDELCSVDAAAIIKVGRHFDKVMRVIASAGLGARAVLVEAATENGQCIRRLEDIEDRSEAYFSMVLVSQHRRAGA